MFRQLQKEAKVLLIPKRYNKIRRFEQRPFLGNQCALIPRRRAFAQNVESYCIV